jgi:hypothetical protein
VADRAGLENRCAESNPIDATIISLPSSDAEPKRDSAVLASCLALLARESPDLALIAYRWDGLPEAVRAGIVAMVKASSKGG